jgi:hypothetical protein
MMQRRALAALVAAFVLVASTELAHAQDAVPADVPVVEPLPTTALPAAAPPALAAPVAPPAPPQMIHQPYVWLAGPGGFAFLVSYGAAFLLGGLFSLTPTDNSSDIGCGSICHTQAALMMIPVAGPLLSFTTGPHSASDTKIGLWWSGIEGVGLVMLVVGLIGHDVPQMPLPGAPTAPGRVSVVPLLTPEGGALSLRAAW